ncbi:MAG: hypothetical protein Q9M34_07495 [Sulfurimonas sp.]|nr:hypothetical protein [Sulfurimonas sp.]
MKLCRVVISLTLSLLILSGCGSRPKPVDRESAVLDQTLPLVALTKRGVIVGTKSVAFEWNSITNPKVKGIYVYKKSPNVEGASVKEESKLKYYTTINNRFSTHYVDTNVKADTRYVYAFKTFTENAEGPISKKIVVNTLPVIESVSWIHSITGMPRVAKIIWRPHTNQKVKAYIIERKTLQDEKWEELDTIEGRLNAEYIDEELKDNFVYMYRLRAITYDGIVSTPSVIVKVVTKALPKPITNLNATKNLPNKIKLTWDESVQKDFALYYLYRSENIDGGYELIAKLHNNVFIDKIKEHGKSYFYRVSAVDKDGLESLNEQTTILGMTLTPPLAPAIVEAKRVGASIEIYWSKSDPRSVSFTVLKTTKKGWFDERTKEFRGIKANKFIDTSIEAGSTYSYVVYSVDKNGIKSDKSAMVKIVIPETDKLVAVAKEAKVKEEKVKAKEEQVQIQSTIVAPSVDLDMSGL